VPLARLWRCDRSASCSVHIGERAREGVVVVEERRGVCVVGWWGG
jgi:hypothetical protein